MSDRPLASARRSKPAPPCTLVIFGVTGDLTKRLLMPALYNLSRWGLLPNGFKILGIGRKDMTADALREQLSAEMESFVADKSGEFSSDGIDQEAWGRVVAGLAYQAGDAIDPAFLTKVAGQIDGSALFYLAVAAKLFGPIVEALGKSGLVGESDEHWRRVIIEKPFGHDLESARALNSQVLEVLREDQVFRIDHFLGKETVQNITAFRFGNGIFEPLWNRDRIDHVQITVAETVGVEDRGEFYDATGAMRDMVPNHLFQLLTMIAMEPPTSFKPDAIRDRKEEVLESVRPISRDDVARSAVRGQYRAGQVRDKAVTDYQAEPKVDPGSTTETFVALRLEIDNWRWAGVPFYLRTGKAMTRRDTEIAIQFKQAPLSLFRDTSCDALVTNWLVMQIQPDEGISLQFGAKVPGPEVTLDPVTMGFKYKDSFKVDPSTGYETLIYDAMIGDPTLFQRADSIEKGWSVVQPVLDAWSSNASPIPTYEAGSAGPAEADELLARDRRTWRPL